MAIIYIDNRPYEVREGQNLLDACLSLGFDIPYFCWHPALGSVGACRLCAVKQFKDEHDTRGKIVMSCMTPAAEGTRLSIEDPEAKAFRAAVIEWLMVNHPHDCPVCDEGGECHLQDMTVMTGHTYRRFRFHKRTYRNQELGPLINHEMNRCIQCYRCIRFYRDYAGGRDLNVFGAHHHVFFGRHEEGCLENEFSGNLVEICPTGVFTDKTFKRHYTRKWDLQTAPSVCVHCGLGCNTIPAERNGQLRRIQNRYHGEVNGYFLCDRGRYGYEFVNNDQRIRQPLLRRFGVRGNSGGGGTPEPVDRETVIEHLKGLLYFGAEVIGLGSPRASLEANFALRALVGPEHFYLGMSEKDFALVSLVIDILQNGPARAPSLREAASADAVLVLGEDVTNAAPMLALALRQSIRNKPEKIAQREKIPLWHDYAVRDAVQKAKGPLFIATPAATKLDEVATGVYHAAPDDIARLGFAVASALSDKAPSVTGLTNEADSLAATIANTLREAEKPLIVSGMGCDSEGIIKAAANIAWALCNSGRRAGLCFTAPECNSMGLGLIGGGSIGEAFRAVHEGRAKTVIILENDLYRRSEKRSVDEFLEKSAHVIVIDSLLTATASMAGLVLPAATFAETQGSFVNNEGRAQAFFRVLQPEGDCRESWQWLRDMMEVAGRPEVRQSQSPDDIVAAMAESMPVFKPARDITLPPGFRMAGMKIPRQSHRYSGRTAMLAHISVHEPKPPDDPDSPLSFSMEGSESRPPPPLITRFWAPGWNSVQALNKFQSEIGGPLRGGDPGRRLIEPAENREVPFFDQAPSAFAVRTDERLLIPLYHIFGSEELSTLAPGIARLAPRPYLALNADDMKVFRIREGEAVEFTMNDSVYRLPARLIPTLPPGVAGMPTGLSGLTGFVLPAWAKGFRGMGDPGGTG